MLEQQLHLGVEKFILLVSRQKNTYFILFFRPSGQQAVNTRLTYVIIFQYPKAVK